MTEKEAHRSVIHLDMDAFYPAVEVLDHPDFKGKPVIVGGLSGRGVVSSASYEARKFGVHSALPMVTAKSLCPQGIYLPVRMARYKEISDQVFDIFHRYTPDVEPLSIDEAFLDVTGSARLFGSPVDIAKNIKQAVREEIGLTISAGVAPSKFVAKIASDIEKPDGLTVVHPEKIREFLDPLPISKMWGVGKVTHKALARLSIHTFKDMRTTPIDVLEKKFGKHGIKMHDLSMGIDERDVENEHETKSIGHEVTFSEDILQVDQARKELLSLSEKVARRMRHEDVKGKTITLKVRYSDFTLKTRSTTLKELTNDGSAIYRSICKLLDKTEVGKRPVRLLGISLSHLNGHSTGTQLSLFGGNDDAEEKRKDLNVTLDSIQERFGKNVVRPGTLINKK